MLLFLLPVGIQLSEIIHHIKCAGENFNMCTNIRLMRPVTCQGHSITMRAIRPINELDNVTQ